MTKIDIRMVLLLATGTILLATVTLVFIAYGMRFHAIAAMLAYAMWVPFWAYPISWAYRRRSL